MEEKINLILALRYNEKYISFIKLFSLLRSLSLCSHNYLL